MDMDECVNLLRDRVRKLHPWNPEGIVAYIVSWKTPAEIREYVEALDDKIWPLIVEAKSASVPTVQQFSQLPPLQPPPWGHGSPFPHSQLQTNPSSSFCGIQAPFPPFGEIGPWQTQVQPSGYFHGIQAPLAPSVPTGPCRFFHLSKGYCKKGEHCRFSHESGFPEMHNKRQVHTLETLPMLEKEIRELLFAQQLPQIPIESLANIYIERYGKPLRVDGKAGYNFLGLLMRLSTTRVIERQGQRYIVPVEDAHKFLADDFKIVMPSAINGSNKIYITFEAKSTFTKQDALNYFSRYGPVHDVRIPLRQKRMFGFVSFRYPETVKWILSERSPSTPHFICGDQVFVKACKEKHELEQGSNTWKLAKEDAHSNSGSPKLPVHSVNEAGPPQADNMVESSHVPNRLDEAPATQDSDDFGLPENLDDIYL